MKTPIIYYGGKTTLLPDLLPLVPDHKVYTETFFGGGAMFWAKNMAQNETINDKLDFVVNFYKVLQSDFKKLKQLISASCFSRNDHDKALLIYRNHRLFNAVEKAWALWLLSNLSHGNKLGGGMKYSNDQYTCVPKVMKKAKDMFTDQMLARIENAHIENQDAIKILIRRDVKDAFHFIDPPYPNADQGHYAGYGWNDLEALLQLLGNIKGKFMLTNYPSQMLDKYIEENNWWNRKIQINNKGMRKDGRSKTEIIVCNYKPIGTHELPFH
jgi:DNA adenine methylase